MKEKNKNGMRFMCNVWDEDRSRREVDILGPVELA